MSKNNTGSGGIAGLISKFGGATKKTFQKRRVAEGGVAERGTSETKELSTGNVKKKIGIFGETTREKTQRLAAQAAARKKRAQDKAGSQANVQEKRKRPASLENPVVIEEPPLSKQKTEDGSPARPDAMEVEMQQISPKSSDLLSTPKKIEKKGGDISSTPMSKRTPREDFAGFSMFSPLAKPLAKSPVATPPTSLLEMDDEHLMSATRNVTVRKPRRRPAESKRSSSLSPVRMGALGDKVVLNEIPEEGLRTVTDDMWDQIHSSEHAIDTLIKEKNTEALQTAIDKDGSVLNRPNSLGFIPIFTAVKHDHIDGLKIMLEKDGDLVEAEHEYWGDILLYAMYYEKMEAAQLIIEKNPDVALKQNSYQKNALHFAVQKNYEALVEQILRLSNTDIVKTTDKNGLTPMHYAADGGNMGIIEMILQKDRSVLEVADKYGNIPMHNAAMSDNTGDIIKLFFKLNKTGLDRQNEYHKLPIELAVQMGNVSVVEACMGLNSNYKLDQPLYRDEYSASLFHLAAATDRSGKVVNVMLQKNKTLTQLTDKKGQTPIHYAAEAGNTEVMKSLIKGVYREDNSKLTPLDLAIQKGQLSSVQRLLELSEVAKYHQSNTQNSVRQNPVHIAAKAALNISRSKGLSAAGKKEALANMTKIIEVVTKKLGQNLLKDKNAQGQSPLKILGRKVAPELSEVAQALQGGQKKDAKGARLNKPRGHRAAPRKKGPGTHVANAKADKNKDRTGGRS